MTQEKATEKEVLEQRIEGLLALNKDIIDDSNRIKEDMKRLEKAYNENGRDVWYVHYLRDSLARAGETHERQEQTIKAYRDYFDEVHVDKRKARFSKSV